MTQQEVIKAIMDFYNLNGSQLAYEIGMNPSRINFIAMGRTKRISRAVYRALLKRFPTLNPKFIMQGLGSMHLKECEVQNEVTVSEMVDLILQQYRIEPQRMACMLGWDVQTISLMRSGDAYKTLSAQRIRTLCNVFKELNPQWLKTGRGEMFVGGRVIDSSLPMPKPYVSYKAKKIALQPKTKKTDNSVDKSFDQAKVNSLLMEQLVLLRKEVAELKKMQSDSTVFVADDINKDI